MNESRKLDPGRSRECGGAPGSLRSHYDMSVVVTTGNLDGLRVVRPGRQIHHFARDRAQPGLWKDTPKRDRWNGAADRI